MTAAIQLSNAALRCEIAPALGGCIAGLWLGDTPVLRSTPAQALTSARQSGCYPLVQNTGDDPHVIHSVGWQRPWTVLETTPDFALLSYEHKPDEAWPFAFDTSQAFRLSANARWEMSPEKLPTHRTAAQGLDTDCAALNVDHCFEGWPGVVHLNDALLHTRITSSLDRLVVFTNDTRNFVAIEPASHVESAP